MHHILRLLGWVAGLTIAVSSVMAKTMDVFPDRDTPVPADQPIPIIDFLRPFLFVDPVLNFSGTHFAAYITNQSFNTNMLICEIASGKILPSTKAMQNSDHFRWLSDTELVEFGKNYALFNKFRGQTVGDSNYPRVVDIRHPEKTTQGKDVLASYLNKKRGAIPGTDFLWEFTAPIMPYPWIRYWANPENGGGGHCVTMSDDGVITLFRFDGKHWMKCPVDLAAIELLDIGEKPDEMIVLGPRQEGKPRAVQRLDTVTGQLGEVLYQDSRYDCEWLAFRPYDGTDNRTRQDSPLIRRRGSLGVLGISVPYSAAHTAWLDPKLEDAQRLVNKQFPNAVAQIVSSDLTKNRFLVKISSDRIPASFYFADLEKHTLGLVKNTAPWIDSARMRPMQLMSYKARDGSVIEAYLTLPAGASKEHPAPLVVLPHAGPWSRNSWGWDYEAQFLASRGYAVFQPNYRGSAGYDWRFGPQDRWDFRKMHDDVTDGVKAVLTTGLIDVRRLAIMGSGFGGYLAICGAVYEPDLYRCAITMGGVFDWEKMVSHGPGGIDTTQRMVRRYLGDPKLEKDKYLSISPLKRINALKIPVFIANTVSVADLTQGSQTDELARALKGRVPCVVFGDLNLFKVEDAWEDAIACLGKIESFLATNLAAEAAK